MKTRRPLVALTLMVVLAALVSAGCGPRREQPIADAPSEKTSPSTQPIAQPVTAEEIFNNGNTLGVYEGGKRPSVKLTQDVVITEISTYHYNQMKGATPGTISLEGDDGKVYGPWQTSGLVGQGDVQNATWVAKPNATVPAGTYAIVDSDPATWSQNDTSKGFGFTTILGRAAK
ncbi:MAG: hypothetical protein Q7W16_05770 [Coriobacteriia bacterium]|nr:hypothetical protein [Coriobacteriia bacterium]